MLSNRDIRVANARLILSRMWEAEAVTGSELIAATGLTRATVHDVCQELRDLGWIEELPNQRAHGGYVKGRPARRYALSERAGVVVGVDSGDHRVIATVADLRGRVIAQHTAAVPAPDDDRRVTVAGAVLDALAGAVVPPRMVLVVVVGVPAPVDADGHTVIDTNPFWNRVNPGIGAHLAGVHGWTTVVDNDANLASLAEGWIGGGRDQTQYVTLLSGERLGAGVIVDGRLLRGGRGAAGEMVFLDHVEGVGSADGIASLSRTWDAPGATRSAERIFAAARDGDPDAAAIIDRLGERFARVAAALGKIFDPDLIILAGAVASACEPILEVLNKVLPTLAEPPFPRVVASELGEAVVSVGAVRRAIAYVQEHALDIALPAPQANGRRITL